MSPAQLGALRLVAPPEPARQMPVTPLRVSRGHDSAHRARKWPDYSRCLQSAPRNHSGTGPDVSRADFTWCLTAIDWGFGVQETASKLLEVSAKAKENGERYASLTAQNAAKAAERKGPTRG